MTKNEQFRRRNVIDQATGERTRRRGPSFGPNVSLTDSKPDWCNLEWGTLYNLARPVFDISSNFCTKEEDLKAVLHALLKFPLRSAGSVFANPRYTISAAVPSSSFIRAARFAQQDWLRQTRTVLGNTRRYMASLDPDIRQLCFTGVLVFKGRLVRNNAWPQQ